MVYGTLSTLDQFAGSNQLVQDFGEDNLADHVRRALAVHNDAMQEMLSDFALITADRERPYGAGDDMTMQELDQFGSPDVQKTTAAGNYGLPLRWYGIAVQWNRHFILNATTGELTARFDAAAAADARNVTRQIRRTLFNPVNNLSYIDLLQSKLTLPLRAMLNGDGRAIPIGPNGEVFPGSHTHFSGEASLTEAGLKAKVDTVVEHGVGDGTVVIYINRAQEQAVRGFAGFDRYIAAGIRVGAAEQIALGTLNTNDPTDRAIGLFEGAEVWVKPWIPADYQVVFIRSGGDKLIGIRTRSGTLGGDAYAGGFGALYEDDLHPLRARGLGREFGVGIITPHKGAAHYSANATYTMPASL